MAFATDSSSESTSDDEPRPDWVREKVLSSDTDSTVGPGVSSRPARVSALKASRGRTPVYRRAPIIASDPLELEGKCGPGKTDGAEEASSGSPFRYF